MKQDQRYTTEELSRKFNSRFRLVEHAIDVAKQMVGADRQCRVNTEINNRAHQALLEILEGQDALEARPGDLPLHEPLVMEPIEPSGE